MPPLLTHGTPTPHTHDNIAVNDELVAELVLLGRLLADESAAWIEFNRRYVQVIQHAITRVTQRFSTVLSPDDANEIYSIFLLQLLQNDKHKLRSFDPTRCNRLSSWLRLLATHAAYDFLRSRRRDPNEDDSTVTDTFPSGDPDPFACCLVREQALRASALMASLSERDREFVQLYFSEGLEPEAVAKRMGISVKTVYSKKHKLCARLDGLVGELNLAA